MINSVYHAKSLYQVCTYSAFHFSEEILHSDNSIWQSPDGRFIVYASISDIEVHRYDMTLYGNSKYVENKRLAYPKVRIAPHMW